MVIESYAYVQAPRSEFTELARTRKGKVYRKQILKFGAFPHPAKPGEKLIIDDGMADTLIKNFENEVCDIVQVPLANDQNLHIEDPSRNIGEVIALRKEKDGVYADIDVRKSDAIEGIDNHTLLGVSAMMHMNYTDTRTGSKVGPTLLHTLVTNRPYLTGMKGFEEVVAASVPGIAADTNAVDVPVFGDTNEEEVGMTLSELLEQLKSEHDIDVVALQEQVTKLSEEAPVDIEAIKREVSDEVIGAMRDVLADAGATGLSAPDDDDETVTLTDVAEAVIELAQEASAKDETIAVLTAKNEENEQKAAEAEVSQLVKEGKILPTQREAMVKLARSDREMFASLIPASPIVSLSQEGVEVHEDTATAEEKQKLDEDIARLSGIANEMTPGGVAK